MMTPVRLILAGAGLALALPLYAATTSPLPQAHRQGEVTYLAGGVGKAKRYINLTMTGLGAGPGRSLGS